jgi:hypothetical protein
MVQLELFGLKIDKDHQLEENGFLMSGSFPAMDSSKF